MRLLFVRHAEPNYENDCLTEKGVREALLLAERMKKEQWAECYCSSMNRARQTAAPFLEATGSTAEYCDWLREFEHTVVLPDGSKSHIAWDLAPKVWTEEAEHYDKDVWYLSRIAKSGHLEEFAKQVTEGFDAVLAEHGYVRRTGEGERDGRGIMYDAVAPNHDTLLFVCHFGVMSVILGHLLGLSPMQLWHTTGAPCSSLTQVYTEEIEEGTAIFRVNFYGDISHLYVADEPLSFNPRLTECAGDPPQRTYQGKAF